MDQHQYIMELCEDLLNELEDRYDGAPDSSTRWMGSYIERLMRALVDEPKHT